MSSPASNGNASGPATSTSSSVAACANWLPRSFSTDDAYVNVFGEGDPSQDIMDLWDYSREMTARITWKPWMWTVALPMLVATISILIVYLPIMFFTGIVKFLFVPLALAVAYAMVVSYLTSMTVAPVAMTALFREQAHAPVDHPRLFDRLFGSLVDRYILVLRWCLAHKALVVGVVTLTFGGSLLLAPRLATEFFPRVDAGQFILNVAAPEGTRVEKT